MENGLKSVKEMFEGRKVFCIPEYQRAYAWELDQLKDFIDDYSNFKMEEGKKYFIGTVLLQNAGKTGDTNDKFEVVDGQQRITTLIIFIKCILDKISKGKKIYNDTYIQYGKSYKLQVLQEDNEFFATYILGNRAPLPEYIKTPSQKRLYNAKKFFEEQLISKSQKQLKEYLEKIEASSVLTYTVKDKVEATLIFETTNDRGKDLTSLERIKSFFMYNTYLSTGKPEDLLGKLQSRFSEIYKEYSEIESLISEESIIQYYYIAFEKWSDKKEYQSYFDALKKRINELVQKNKKEAALKYIEEFSLGLKEAFTITKTILKRTTGYYPDVEFLNHRASFLPLLIKAYKYDSDENKVHFEEICRLSSIFSFRVFNILGGRSDKGVTTLYSMARDFTGDYVLLSEKFRESIDYYGPVDKFIERIEACDFYTENDSRERNFFFWKYENCLRKLQPKAAAITYETFVSKDSKTKFSIEHIIPQNPTEETRKIITTELEHCDIDENFEKAYLHCVGNLTIDPVSANSSKGKSDYEMKESTYFKRAPFKSQNELEDFLFDNKWTHKSIEKRKEKIVDFAKVEWCFASIVDFEAEYKI